jgi:hypothetical protein
MEGALKCPLLIFQEYGDMHGISGAGPAEYLDCRVLEPLMPDPPRACTTVGNLVGSVKFEEVER